MNRRIIAIIASLCMVSGAMTACGDSSDDSGAAGTSGNTVSSGEENDTGSATEADAEATTEDKLRGKGESISPKTEPATEAHTLSIPQKPGDIDEICIDPTDMAGMTVAEIADLFGDYDVESDEIVGYYYIHNEAKMPGVTFHFIDHTWDDMWEGNALPTYRYEELRRRISASRAIVTKINCRETLIDQFRTGMSYRKCAEIIGDFPVSGSDNGVTFCGCPLSLAYYYLHSSRNCVVALHFELKGELDRALHEGRLTTGKSYDVMPADMKKYDPVLQNIEIIYAPDRTDTSAELTASSQLGDINSGGKSYNYDPKNLVDGDMTTCWCEDREDVGIGESFRYSSSGNRDISFVTIYGGLRSNPEAFYKNCRPSKINISSDGFNTEYVLQTYYSNNYIRALPVSCIKKAEFTFTVSDVDSDSVKYSDTCISEIRFNGYNPLIQ